MPKDRHLPTLTLEETVCVLRAEEQKLIPILELEIEHPPVPRPTQHKGAKRDNGLLSYMSIRIAFVEDDKNRLYVEEEFRPSMPPTKDSTADGNR